MELHDLTALEAAAAVRAREVSPVELVTHALERAYALGDTVGAFVTLTADRALQEATQAQARADDDELPPFHGVPTAIKDLNLTAGVPTKMGSRAFADFVPPIDDDVVTALRAAGTISIGKTNTPEVGLPCYTEPDPSIAPPARTPWDLTRSAGGSSGGAAAAVSSGIVPVASASDGGGSIRIPASVTGLVGLKPSRGRVSNGPLGTDWSGLVHQHVLTRSVADSAAFLDAIAQDTTGGPFHAATRRPPERLRIARSVDNVLGVTPHAACLSATDATCTLLAELGHEVEDVAGPVLPAELYDQFMVLWCTGAGAIPIDPAREHLLLPLTRALRTRGQELGAVALATALGLIGMAVRAARARFAGYDVIVSPTLAALPALVGQLRDDDDPWGDLDAQGRFTPYTAVHNVTGWPSISLPLHWVDVPRSQAPGGVSDAARITLPVGVLLTAHAGQDATLLALAAQLEAARPWRSRRPPLW